MIDLHTHHERCGHADGTLLDVATWAVQRGIDVLGFSDHAPLFAHPDDHPQPGTQMARSEWSAYLAEAVNVRSSLARELDVRVGVEADYLPGTEDAYRTALARPELDYVIGSVHEVGDWHIYRPRTFEDVDADAFHRGYWERVQGAARSGLFDVLAHLDAIRAKVPPPKRDLTGLIEETLDVVAESGVAVEVNGSGLRRDGEVYPRRAILEGLVTRGVPITIGSDAHAPDQLGMGWKEARRTLLEFGATEVATFRKREREMVPLGVVGVS